MVFNFSDTSHRSMDALYHNATVAIIKLAEARVLIRLQHVKVPNSS